METSEFLGAVHIGVDTRFIGKKVEVDLGGGDDRTVVHDFPFHVFWLLDDAEVEDLVLGAFVNLWSAFLIPGLVVVGHALLINEAFTSDVLEEANKDSTFNTSLFVLLVVARSVSLSIKSNSLLSIRFQTESIRQSTGSNNSVVGGAVALVLDWRSAIGELLPEVILLWDNCSVVTILILAELQPVGLAVTVEDVVHGGLGILEHPSFEKVVFASSEGVLVPFGFGVPCIDGVLVDYWGGLGVNCFLAEHKYNGY